MTTPAGVMEEREVSPLELFYDLVFVFAVSQLSEHLVGRPNLARRRRNPRAPLRRLHRVAPHHL